MEPPDDPPASGDYASADLTAGRLVSADAVVCWLGGWHLAQGEASVALPAAPSPPAPEGDREGEVVWTVAAVATCDRIRRIVAALDPAAERRLAAIIVATMVRLAVEPPDRTGTVADLPLLPALAIRIRVARSRVIVLGLGYAGRIR